MAKKKKKSSSLSSPSSPSFSLQQTQQQQRQHQQQERNKEDAHAQHYQQQQRQQQHFSDVLRVRLSSSSSDARGQQQQRQPRQRRPRQGGRFSEAQPHVVLSDGDAARLDVASGDLVVLLAKQEDQDDIVGVLIHRAYVAPPSSNGCSTLQTKQQHQQGGNVSPGTVHVTSTSSVDVLLNNHRRPPSNDGADDSPPPSPSRPGFVLSTPPPPPPTTTNAQTAAAYSFSFKDRVNGPKRSTPTTATPTNREERRKKGRALLLLLNARSKLGSGLVRAVCGVAGTVALKPIVPKGENNKNRSNAVDPTQTTIFQRIILANIMGRYVQAGERIRCTFLGKPVELQVERVVLVTTTTTPPPSSSERGGTAVRSAEDDAAAAVDAVEERLSTLSVRDDADDGDNGDNGNAAYANAATNNEEIAVQDWIRTTGIRLGLVAQSTAIELEREMDEEEEEGEETEVREDAGVHRNGDDAEAADQQPSPNRELVFDNNTKSRRRQPPPQQRRYDPPTPPPQQYVAGLDGTLEQLRSLLVRPLTAGPGAVACPRGDRRRTAKPPRGVLLHGPSGVGKSSLVKQLIAELRSCGGCHVEYINCTSLQSQTSIVGEAERQLSNVFRNHRNHNNNNNNLSATTTTTATKLIVMDDIHLICSKRGSGGNGSHSGTDRLAATLLSLMDGAVADPSSPNNNNNDNTQICVLAITNNPSSLDPALRRPGRLDAEIEVPIPDEPSARAEILRFCMRDMGVRLVGATAEDAWLDLGKRTKGFNGADCRLAVKEAVRKHMLRPRQRQQQQEEDPAFDSVRNSGNCVGISVDDMCAAIRETKPSAIKSVTVEIPQVLWASIGGMESVKRELREAVELPLTHGDLFRRLNVPPPKGILLYGPPGCSKTLMARALATEGQMNFLAVKGPELLSKWLGESERALASLFRRARMASPCIIFFDEIDAIAIKRGSGDSASSSRLLSQLLTELDGVNNNAGISTVHGNNKKQRVVVIGATNRPDLLDTALTRPGRIDRMIYVGVPDEKSRAKIFEISLKDRLCSSDIDIPRLATDGVSQGFSGAEIVAICRDAASLALEEASDTVPADDDNNKNAESAVLEMRHLQTAIRGMRRQITPEMLAFYESFYQST